MGSAQQVRHADTQRQGLRPAGLSTTKLCNRDPGAPSESSEGGGVDGKHSQGECFGVLRQSRDGQVQQLRGDAVYRSALVGWLEVSALWEAPRLREGNREGSRAASGFSIHWSAFQGKSSITCRHGAATPFRNTSVRMDGTWVGEIDNIFSVRPRTDEGPIRWEPTTLVITTTSACWWWWVERRTGLLKSKVDRWLRLETTRLPRDCNVSWTAARYTLGGETHPYCLACGDAFVTRMPELLQEAVDALPSVGCEVEVRDGDPPVRLVWVGTRVSKAQCSRLAAISTPSRRSDRWSHRVGRGRCGGGTREVEDQRVGVG